MVLGVAPTFVASLTANLRSLAEVNSLRDSTVTLHNEYRARHGSPPLVWNETLATYAAQFLDSAKCDFKLSDGPYGENTGFGYSTPEEAIAAWYDQNLLYDYDSNAWQGHAGLFTQLVWNTTTQVGCAQTKCGPNTNWLVCSYYPPGNVFGQFKSQVKKPIDSVQPTGTTELPLEEPTEIFSQPLSAECLKGHNDCRSRFGVPELVWDEELATYAENFLEKAQCNFAHSGGPWGENLALGYKTPSEAISAWTEEEEYYDYDKPGFSMDTGHFTQVVWRDTRRVGCAIAECPVYGQFFVCEYAPRGNVLSRFEGNVLRPLSWIDTPVSSPWSTQSPSEVITTPIPETATCSPVGGTEKPVPLKEEDKLDSVKVVLPTEAAVIELPTEAAVIELPTEAAVIELPTEAAVIERPTEAAVIENTLPKSVSKVEGSTEAPNETIVHEGAPKETVLPEDFAEIEQKELDIQSLFKEEVYDRSSDEDSPAKFIESTPSELPSKEPMNIVEEEENPIDKTVIEIEQHLDNNIRKPQVASPLYVDESGNKTPEDIVQPSQSPKPQDPPTKRLSEVRITELFQNPDVAIGPLSMSRMVTKA